MSALTLPPPRALFESTTLESKLTYFAFGAYTLCLPCRICVAVVSSAGVNPATAAAFRCQKCRRFSLQDAVSSLVGVVMFLSI